MLRSPRYSLLSLALLALFGSRTIQAQPLPDRVPLLGQVQDQDGGILADVLISIRRQDDTGAYAFWGSQTSSDSQGRFGFPDAEEGRYFLNAEKNGYAQLLNQSVTWGNSTEPLRLRMERLARIKLRVLQPDGSVLKNSGVMLRLRGEPGVAQMYRRQPTNKDGELILEGLPPAQYSMSIIVPGVGNAQLNDITGRYAAEPAPVETRLQPGGGVRVRAVEKVAEGAPGRPLGGAQVVLVPNTAVDPSVTNPQAVDPNDNIGLLATQNNRQGLITRDGEGVVTLSDLPPGQYSARLIVPGWPNPPIKSVEITAGKTAELEWELPARASGNLTLNIRGSDGQPLARQDILVRLMPLGPPSGEDEQPVPTPPFGAGFSNMRQGTTDDSGKLTLFPLRAGKYRLWVSGQRTGMVLDRRGAVSIEAQATVAGSSVDVTLPQTPAKP